MDEATKIKVNYEISQIDELIDKFKRMQDKYKVDMNKIIYNKITNKLLGINIVIIKIYENIKTDSDKEK